MNFIKSITILIMSIFYIGIGIAHFIFPERFLIIMPPFLPFPIFLIYLSGFLEILLGCTLLIKRFRVYAGIGLIFLLLLVFPANIYLYVDDEARKLYGEISQQQAFIRLFFQIPLLVIAYWHSQAISPKWVSYTCVGVFIPTVFYFISILFY